MNRTIWKFEVKPDRSCCKVIDEGNCEPVSMPKGSVILSAADQGEGICIWAEVDPSAEMVEEFFDIFGTGHGMSEDKGRKFIDTVFLYGGKLVFHVYHLPGVL